MIDQRVRFKVTNDMNPEKLDEVVAHFEEIFQQHGLEVSTVSTKFYGTNIKIKGGDVIHADVGLALDVSLKYARCTCRAVMKGFFIRPGKWKNKKWNVELITSFNDESESITLSQDRTSKSKMKTEDLIKYVKKYAL